MKITEFFTFILSFLYKIPDSKGFSNAADTFFVNDAQKNETFLFRSFKAVRTACGRSFFHSGSAAVKGLDSVGDGGGDFPLTRRVGDRQLLLRGGDEAGFDEYGQTAP